jgi:hypothetical protein
MTIFFQRSQYLFRQLRLETPIQKRQRIQGPDFVKIKVPRVMLERRRLSAGKRAWGLRKEPPESSTVNMNNVALQHGRGR